MHTVMTAATLVAASLSIGVMAVVPGPGLQEIIARIRVGTDEHVAAQNFTTWVMLYAVAVCLFLYVWRRYRSDKGESLLNVALFGAALDAWGWGLHRQFWWVWRQLRSMGNCDSYDAAEFDFELCQTAIWFIDQAWVTTVATMVIWTGVAFMSAPITHAFAGKWWPVFSFAFILSAYTVGLSLAVLPAAFGG